MLVSPFVFKTIESRKQHYLQYFALTITLLPEIENESNKRSSISHGQLNVKVLRFIDLYLYPLKHKKKKKKEKAETFPMHYFQFD